MVENAIPQDETTIAVDVVLASADASATLAELQHLDLLDDANHSKVDEALRGLVPLLGRGLEHEVGQRWIDWLTSYVSGTSYRTAKILIALA
jgi:hypothetical protein